MSALPFSQYSSTASSSVGVTRDTCDIQERSCETDELAAFSTNPPAQHQAIGNHHQSRLCAWCANTIPPEAMTCPFCGVMQR